MTVSIQTFGRTVAKINSKSNVSKLSKKWANWISCADNWIGRENQDFINKEAIQDLKILGVTTEELQYLGHHQVIEVSFSKDNGRMGWDLPWEHLLAKATRPYRSESCVVVRHLEVDREPHYELPTSALVAELGSPKDLVHRDFFTEERRLRTSMYLHDENKILRSPKKNQLKRDQSDVIHLTGVDCADAAKHVTGAKRGGQRNINSLAFAIANHGPHFVGCNLPYSGFSLAPTLVLKGAGAVLGLGSVLSHEAAELFFFNYYNSTGANVRTESDEINPFSHIIGFCEAWNKTNTYREFFRGCGVALWSIKSIRPIRRGKKRILAPQPVAMINAKETKTKVSIRDYTDVHVEPAEQINYSLLHNGRSPFKQFKIDFHGTDQKTVVQLGKESSEFRGLEFRNVKLNVELNIGDESFPFRRSLTIGDECPTYDFARGSDAIHVSLLSDNLKNIQEPTQTNLFVELTWEDQTLYQNTFRVRLSPMDAWRLNDTDIWWLPSFVQPRDPAVAQIMYGAQARLECMTDNTEAGLNGYQDLDSVDQQVAAIWHSIIADPKPRYINPPPSFSNSTQRLRMPSDVAQEGRGTCVDLALLFAACLEWIEIYPTIFMLEGHAFPGYWQTDADHEEFMCERISAQHNDVHGHQAWVHRDKERILSYINAGKLIPLETVNLTHPRGFMESYHDEFYGGLFYFDKKNTEDNPLYAFHSMIDIYSARQHGVTALPVGELSMRPVSDSRKR